MTARAGEFVRFALEHGGGVCSFPRQGTIFVDDDANRRARRRHRRADAAQIARVR